MPSDRRLRKLFNSKQDTVEFSGEPSISSMMDGQLAVTKGSNGQLAVHRKRYGKLWRSYMSYDGNQYVDRNLNVSNNITVNGTVFGNQLYIFTHSFDMTFTTSKVYLPWNATTENTAIATGFYDQFITPYSGRLIKVMARPETAAGSTAIGLHKARDLTTDPSGTATESITVNISSADTTYEFAFTGAASFTKGDTVALSFNPSSDPNHTKISSVWSFKVI